MQQLKKQFVVIGINIIYLIPVIIFLLWCSIDLWESKRKQLNRSVFSSKNMKKLMVNFSLFISAFFVLCLAINIRFFYHIFANRQTQLNAGLITFVSITSLTIAYSIVLHSEQQLLDHQTLPILLCLAGYNWNILVVKIAAFLFMAMSLWSKGSFTRMNTLQKLLKLLLVLLFTLDMMTGSITILFFSLLNLSLVALVLSQSQP